MNDPVSLVPGKTDKERADDYRARLTPLLEQAAAIVGEARQAGFIIGFNISPDQFGRVKVQTIDVTKPL